MSKYESEIFLLDDKINELKKQMKLPECLTLIEKSLIIKSEKYGKKSPEFISSGKQLCEVCNLIAIGLAEKGKTKEGLSYLEKAEKLFSNYKEILNICLNNLGCYNIITEDYDKSISYLEKALKLAIELGNKKFAGETYLNISTVFNRLNKYQDAIEQCFNSIITIQELITDPSESISDEEYASSINILIIAYRNLAVLYDNSNDIHNALLYYKMSENIFEDFKKLPSAMTILKDATIKTSIIDNNYKLSLFKNLKKDIGNLFKQNSLIGKEGKDYYSYFLDEIIRSLESSLENNLNNEMENDEEHSKEDMENNSEKENITDNDNNNNVKSNSGKNKVNNTKNKNKNTSNNASMSMASQDMQGMRGIVTEDKRVETNISLTKNNKKP